MGKFIISLDFEMMWGAIFNQSVLEGYRYRVPYVPIIVPRLLELFKKYNIHATWAIVGAIACENKEEAYALASRQIDDPYGKESLHEFIEQIPQEDFNLYFRRDLVEQITHTPHQEIATHTMTHFYCDEHSDMPQKLNDELSNSKKILESVCGRDIQSVVLPKNQVSDKSVSVMKDCGMTVFRGKQKSKRFNKETKVGRILRFLDAYIPICGCNAYRKEDVSCCRMANIRASRFFRTYYSPLRWFEKWKLHRILREMKYAAKEDMIYHLWFHPHNLSAEYETNLKTIEAILSYYVELSSKYDFQSVTMLECAKDI